ncbi:hypothetical protein [Streptomyces lincolnensis]|uniref:hypothetical protein n=1 Tax=Streptomyces lincolnensis TaxID=1915 RepID=UPI0037D4F34F
MSTDQIVIEVVFEHSILTVVESDVISRLACLLSRSAPEWTSCVTVWSPNPRERVMLNEAELRSDLRTVVEGRTRWVSGERHAGSVELRGASNELNVVVSVNDNPLALVGGKLLMTNGVTITSLKKKVAGVPQADWMRSFFAELCAEVGPAWGAIYSNSEYREKVMEEGRVLRAVGRDFSRYIPGFFSVNYFGEKYSQLIGRGKFQQLEPSVARPLGNGWIVEVAPDPLTWKLDEVLVRNRDLLRLIGAEFFFQKGNDQMANRAPGWGT